MLQSGLTPRSPCLWNTPPKAGGTHTSTPLWVYKADGALDKQSFVVWT